MHPMKEMALLWSVHVQWSLLYQVDELSLDEVFISQAQGVADATISPLQVLFDRFGAWTSADPIDA